jgi:hypothetical protein
LVVEEDEEGREEEACAAARTRIFFRTETMACLWERRKALPSLTLSLEGWREERREDRAVSSSGFRAGGREGGREGLSGCGCLSGLFFPTEGNSSSFPPSLPPSLPCLCALKPTVLFRGGCGGELPLQAFGYPSFPPSLPPSLHLSLTFVRLGEPYFTRGGCGGELPLQRFQHPSREGREGGREGGREDKWR